MKTSASRVELADVDHVGAQRALQDRQVERLVAHVEGRRSRSRAALFSMGQAFSSRAGRRGAAGFAQVAPAERLAAFIAGYMRCESGTCPAAGACSHLRQLCICEIIAGARPGTCRDPRSGSYLPTARRWAGRDGGGSRPGRRRRRKRSGVAAGVGWRERSHPARARGCRRRPSAGSCGRRWRPGVGAAVYLGLNREPSFTGASPWPRSPPSRPPSASRCGAARRLGAVALALLAFAACGFAGTAAAHAASWPRRSPRPGSARR